MELIIYRAVDAFLYLPTYIAEEFGIFDTLLKEFGITKVTFKTPEKGSDLIAIENMMEENANSNHSISIAIADPTTFLLDIKNETLKNCRVIGALIDKLPFWGVNHIDKIFESKQDLASSFDTVIYYNETMQTGNFLGHEIINETNIREKKPVYFGEEIPMLIKLKQDTPLTKVLAITADIVSIVRGANDRKERLKINYSFSSEGAFLTTGILTSQKVCEKFPKQLVKILEGIQKSISILYSSEIIARNICDVISNKPIFLGTDSKNKLSSDDVNLIIELINKEKFYPADLNISKDSWNKALGALAKCNQWPEKRFDELKDSFDDFVINDFVIESEKLIAKQFGISIDTFKGEIIKFFIRRWFKKISSILKKWWIRLIIVACLAVFIFFYKPEFHFNEIIGSIFAYFLVELILKLGKNPWKKKTKKF